MSLQLSGLALLLLTIPASAAERFTGPWKMAELKRTPLRSVEAGPGIESQRGLLRERPARRETGPGLCLLRRARQGAGAVPGDGAGPRRRRESVPRMGDTLGGSRLCGHRDGPLRKGPDGKRLPDGGPEQSDEEKFRDFAPNEADQMWSYHAVAAAVRAHSFLASHPR